MEKYALVKWKTSSKVTSLGIVAESEIMEGDFEVGASIKALHLGEKSYDAVILNIGELEAMIEKKEKSSRAYVQEDSNAPRGRGHRTVKKVVREDFVEADATSAATKEDARPSNKLPTKKALKRKSKSDSSDDIITKVKARNVAVGAHRTEAGSSVTPDQNEESEEPSQVAPAETSELGVKVSEPPEGSFIEAGLIASLRAENARLQRRITELEEEKASYSMSPVLEELAEIKSMVSSLQTRRCNILPPRTTQSTPPRQAQPPLRTIPRSFQSPPPKTVQSPRSVPSPPPSVNQSPSPEPCSPTTPPVEAADQSFQFPKKTLRRADNAVSMGTHVSNLMAALYSRPEMASRSLAGRNGSNQALSPQKLSAIIAGTKTKYPNVRDSEIRVRISTKLRDEKSAYRQQLAAELEAAKKGGIFIVAAKRTPFGSFGGSLKNKTATDLCEIAAAAALKEADINPELVDSTFVGNVSASSADGPYIARHTGIRVGVPLASPALTVNRLCGSGFQAIVSGVQDILCGESEVVLTGGAENMSMAPHVVRGARFGIPLGTDLKFEDTLWATLTDLQIKTPMGLTAETLGAKYGVTREDADQLALTSQQRWKAANDAGYFKQEMVGIEVKTKKGPQILDVDEHPREATIEALRKLPPVFKKDGLVSAGNASGICDGAAVNLLASEEAVTKHNLKPLARIVSYNASGCDPHIMGIGPVHSVRTALEKAGLQLSDMDLAEVNEAFAAQFVAVQRELGLDMEKTNVNGGAVAMGHPVGASGARITAHLTHELRRRGGRYAVGSACIGGGQGIAVVLENIN